jgi:hypothetical protein
VFKVALGFCVVIFVVAKKAVVNAVFGMFLNFIHKITSLLYGSVLLIEVLDRRVSFMAYRHPTLDWAFEQIIRASEAVSVQV